MAGGCSNDFFPFPFPVFPQRGACTLVEAVLLIDPLELMCPFQLVEILVDLEWHLPVYHERLVSQAKPETPFFLDGFPHSRLW